MNQFTSIIVIAAVMSSSTPTAEGYSIIIGLNPALQKRFILSEKTPDLIPGNVHRASSIQTGIGGKGQDVAVTLANLSTAPSNYIYLAQLVGSGAEGDLALSKLDNILSCHDQDHSGDLNMLEKDCKTSEWTSLTVRVKAALRTCTTIIGDNSATELVEPSGVILPGEIQQLKDKISSLNTRRKIRGLCIMGSMPPGCDENLYAELYGMIQKKHPNIVSVIDTVIGLDHLFQQIKSNRLLSSKCMLKVNFAEFCRLANKQGSNSSSEISSVSIQFFESALDGFFNTYPDAKGSLDYIAITNGCHPAYLVCIKKESTNVNIFTLDVPDLSIARKQVVPKVFPIGAGDSVAGGTLAAWEYLQDSSGKVEERLDSSIRDVLTDKTANVSSDMIVATAFSFGIACGSASCLQEENSMLDIQDTLALFNTVKIQKL